MIKILARTLFLIGCLGFTACAKPDDKPQATKNGVEELRRANSLDQPLLTHILLLESALAIVKSCQYYLDDDNDRSFWM